MVSGESQIDGEVVRQLQGVARKLSVNAELQKDLTQEMLVHFVNVRTKRPGNTLSWYIKSCEFHARNYLRLGRSIDSLKRASRGMQFASPHGEASSSSFCSEPTTDSLELEGQLITNDLLDLLLPQLSDKQQQVLFLLMRGFGIRQTARELGVTHPAIIKHRRKIARITRELLQDSEGVGVVVAMHNGENGNGEKTAQAV